MRERVRALVRPSKDPVLAAAVALLVAALCFAAWGGWSWHAAADDGARAYGESRDRALSAAEQGVQNLNTLDHRNVAHGLSTWQQSTTGELRKQLADGRGEFERQVKAAKTVTSAEVLSAALYELDERAGRAGAVVAVRTTVNAPKQKPTTKDTRMRCELSRTSGGWKLSALAQVPVGDSAGESGPGASRQDQGED
ncbi:hypothetical protein [Streptomyces sulphureus]|uniref:hypothetical protein n=1 Tax=Streptomyces sulphureus TaxID=47758 RepID=UPI0003A4953E|nr:hypothetical protein [Streptomyces sulphureus]